LFTSMGEISSTRCCSQQWLKQHAAATASYSLIHLVLSRESQTASYWLDLYRVMLAHKTCVT
jgi:hypothetical protein